MTAPEGVRCDRTGFRLVPASHFEFAWRVAKDEHVNSGGINTVRANPHVGPLPPASEHPRGRFDAIGRTVYFGSTAQTALAEVLQPFHQRRVALEADAQAIGMTVDRYIASVLADADRNGVERPWTVGFDWQFARSIHKVRMPTKGYWVAVEHHDTLNQLSLDLATWVRAYDLPAIDLGAVTGPDRALTTLIADHIRSSTLMDGSPPLGIVFPSKLGYGDALAWWNRRLDDGLMPGTDDPSSIEDDNVGVPAFYEVLKQFGLEGPPKKKS